MKFIIAPGTTNYTLLVWLEVLLGDSNEITGEGKTGVTHNDITISHIRVGTDNDVVLTNETTNMNALASLTSPHNDWGWKEVDSKIAPGWYRLDLDDGVLATGAWSVGLSIIDVGTIVPYHAEIQLTESNTQNIEDIKEQTDKFDFDTSDNINNIINANVVTVLEGEPITSDDLVAKSEVDAIKAQTDQLDFDTSGLLSTYCEISDLTVLEAAVAVIDTNVDIININVNDIKKQTDLLDFDTSGLLQVDCAVGDLATLEANVAEILVDTSTTIPASIAVVDTNVDTINTNVNDIKDQTDLLDFDTSGLLQVDCAVGDLATLEANVAEILVDTSTTIPASIAVIDANVDTILAGTQKYFVGYKG